MKELADKAMRDGACGMATGLIYVPGSFSKTDELIAIAEVVAKHGGIYASHIRNEGSQLLESLDEILTIGKRGEAARARLAHQGQRPRQPGAWRPTRSKSCARPAKRARKSPPISIPTPPAARRSRRR